MNVADKVVESKMSDEPKPLTDEELVRSAKNWQAAVYRNRGPAFVAEAQSWLCLIAKVRRLCQLVIDA